MGCIVATHVSRFTNEWYGSTFQLQRKFRVIQLNQ